MSHLPSDTCLSAPRMFPRSSMRSMAACSVCTSSPLSLSFTSCSASGFIFTLAEVETGA